MKMECPRCHSQDNAFFYEIKGQYYCRKCIRFQRIFLHTERLTKKRIYPQQDVSYQLDFALSAQQLEISHQLLTNYQQKLNSYVWAVCGSGKTEIVFEVIRYALNQGERVCFCIPRKELVKELYERISQAFQNIEIGILYGGHVENQEAQFIVCTMHQLAVFENDTGFSLMISDEVDAFPYYHDDVLEELFKKCCLGNFIQLSATFQKEDIRDGKLLIMNRRYHGYPLPVPRVFKCPISLQKWVVLMIILMKKRWIIFVPTVQCMKHLVHFLKHFLTCVEGVSSQSRYPHRSIQHLKQHDHYILVATTLLERGLTIQDVHVVIYQGENHIFNSRTLIQMAGRVGRKVNYETGYVFILTTTTTKDIRQCVKTIRYLNRIAV
jgi:competence protein ComFA